MKAALQKHPRYLEKPGKTIDFRSQQWGLLFLNMGGPAVAADVETYLYNIFSDKAIIHLPLSALLQKPLARFIARHRAPKVAERYRAIGGGSPLLKWSRLAAEGAKEALSGKYAHLDIAVGMRYFAPYIPDELSVLVARGCRHIMLVSMYPQYCLATTGTALGEVLRWLENTKPDVTISAITEWSDRPEYIAMLRERIERAMEKLDRHKAKVVFSAHSIPQKLADSGDPYLPQIRQAVAAVGQGYDHVLTFQSRTGPVSWVGPDTLQTVTALGRQGVTDMVIVPISFISDHIETLHEIDIELREAALAAGVKRFERTESFNDDPRFSRFLADLIETKISGE